MALFSRRTLQRILNDNAAFVSQAQARAQVRALNAASSQSLDFEWEIAVLNAFSKLGTVRHEPDLEVARKVDLWFAHSGSDDPAFLADIATVSEAGRKEANPIDLVQEQLLRRVRRTELQANRFSIRVDGSLDGSPGHRVMRLRLPARKDIPKLFGLEFSTFLDRCRAAPDREHNYARVDDTTTLQIGYHPEQRYMSISAPSFETSYSLKRNPLYNALKRKARQLRDIPLPVPRGIIICAADTDLASGAAGGTRFRAEQIVAAFLNDYSSISFVLVLYATETYTPGRGIKGPFIVSRLHLNESTRTQIDERTLNCLRVVHLNLPNPVNTGINALGHFDSRWRREGRSFFGSFSMREDTARVSARELLKYLAGRASQEEFLQAHRAGEGWVTLFEIMMRQGRTIESMHLERNDDLDDDWAVFTFGPVDPAIAPLRMPRQDVPES